MDQDDGAIVERVLAGDRDAYGILIDRHGEGATRFALRILRGRADAEDVVQEAWLHAFFELAQLRARDRFVAWLLGIVVNLAKSRLRARRETPVEDWAGGRAIREFVWMDAEPTPEARQEARELHDRIWGALGALPQEQQETVQLHYVEPPVDAVKQRLKLIKGDYYQKFAIPGMRSWFHNNHRFIAWQSRDAAVKRCGTACFPNAPDDDPWEQNLVRLEPSS